MKKVLLVCLDNLGDLVFASALAKALTREPSVHLSLLCKDYTAKIGYLLPGIEQVFAADPFWDRAPNRRKGKLSNFVRCLLTVREHHFDEAYIVGSHWQTALSLRLIGIPKIFAYRGRKNAWLVTRTVALPQKTEPVIGGMLKAFEPILTQAGGRNREDLRPETELLRSRLPQYERPEVLVGKRLVVLHAFAGSPKRCAPLSLWGHLARDLSARGYHILWTGMPSETQAIRKAFPNEWDSSHYVDSWAMDLLQLAWIFSEAELFVGHDSGPLHVAHALGVSVLGLYLPGEWQRTFPQGKGQSIMIHKPSPLELDVKEVIAAALRLLGLAEGETKALKGSSRE